MDEPPATGMSPSPLRTAGAAALALLAFGWVASMLFAARDTLPRLDAVALAGFVAALAIVPALAGIIWLVALRTSAAEARRFGTSARAMRAEAAALEERVGALALVIDDNSAVVAQQIALVDTLAERAAAQLATVGRDLADGIARADDHARSLAGATEATLTRLDVVLAGLPRAQDEITALGVTLERTGLDAGERAAALDAQVGALADRGRTAEAVAGGAAQKLAAHITRMEATSETASMRLEAVTSEMAMLVDSLLDRTAQAMDESRKGIAAQGDAMLAMVATNQAALDTAARESAEALAERIGVIEVVIDRIAGRLDEQRGAGDGLVAGLAAGIDDVGRRLDLLHVQGVERSGTLAASISALGGSADAMTEALRAGEAMATQAIGTTETLLVALDSATREMDETMPGAIERLDAHLVAARSTVGAAGPELQALVTAAHGTQTALEAIARAIADQHRDVDTLTASLMTTLDSGRAQADAMGQMVDAASDRAHRFAEDAAPRLLEALLRVRDTASAAAEHARDTLAQVIPEAAEALEKTGVAALRRAVDDGFGATLGTLAPAAEAAVAASTRAAERLVQHVRAIDAATALVDSRLQDARIEREEHAREGFAKRASALIEALNSASIDITRTFAPDVADSAWSAYLKGDRGVFTRRAVRLLDGNETRDIARLYDEDDAFRDQVNRYIHDFETMLRTILEQRDGSSLAVTLLSSDMGKLYVALAQAIERLR